MAGDPLAIAGDVIGAIGTYKQGIWQKNADYAAALQAQAVGAAQEGRIRDSARQAIGGQIAGQFANGFQGGTGTAVDDVNQSLINGALDALTVRQAAGAKAANLQTQGNVAKSTATFSALSQLLGAGSSAVKQSSDWAAASRGTVTPAAPAAPGGGYNSIGFTDGVPS